jgi:hypothetical protein
MIKDSKKHTSTNGWGYALFEPDGKVGSGDPKKITLSCHACHQIVAQKDFVFSTFLDRSVESSLNDNAVAKFVRSFVVSKPEFEDRLIADLPNSLQAHLPGKILTVRSLKGALTKSIFSGSLNEIRPLLAKEALRAYSPAALISDDKKQFTAVFRDQDHSKKCPAPQGRLSFAMVAVTAFDVNEINLSKQERETILKNDPVRIEKFCSLE